MASPAAGRAGTAPQSAGGGRAAPGRAGPPGPGLPREATDPRGPPGRAAGYLRGKAAALPSVAARERGRPRHPPASMAAAAPRAAAVAVPTDTYAPAQPCAAAGASAAPTQWERSSPPGSAAVGCRRRSSRFGAPRGFPRALGAAILPYGGATRRG